MVGTAAAVRKEGGGHWSLFSLATSLLAFRSFLGTGLGYSQLLSSRLSAGTSTLKRGKRLQGGQRGSKTKK